jgi:O-succinylhomoserine sulfhydrylase
MNPKHFDTKAIRTQLPRTPENEHSTPLFLTSSFVFDNAEDMRAAFAEENDHNIYSRFSNPTVDEFVQKMVLLEEAEAGYATASGMSAVFGTFMTFLKSGDHILSSGSVFGSTHTILTKYIHRWKIEFSYFDISQPGTIESLIRPNTRMLYVETPSNPGLDMVDLELLNTLAKKTRPDLSSG